VEKPASPAPIMTAFNFGAVGSSLGASGNRDGRGASCGVTSGPADLGRSLMLGGEATAEVSATIHCLEVTCLALSEHRASGDGQYAGMNAALRKLDTTE
jgi:hypothetical protein